MSAEPVAPKIRRHTRRNLVHRKSARVGRHDGIGPPDRFYLGEQFSLDLEVFGDRLDDPVTVREQLEVVFEISGRDEACLLRIEKGRGPGLPQGLQRIGDDTVPRRSIVCGRALRHDIEEYYGYSGIREMGRNARTHGPRTKHRRLANQNASRRFGRC